MLPFRACWIASDTSASFNHLAQNAADVSITYIAAAENIARIQGVTDRREYIWRDHWMLVGSSPGIAARTTREGCDTQSPCWIPRSDRTL
jgi:hypothetical protein